MKDKIQAHIISHTHWDREWFLNSKYTNEWLVPFFDSLFEMMEKEEEYRFILDGQTSMIEDYFNELKKQGKDVQPYRDKLSKYVGEGRILVGPYYLQPDWQLLSEESLVRNLLIGHQMAEELGGVMKVGWLLDNFGQISQTAQIHDKFDLQGLYLWRGVEMDPREIKSEFVWESPDGTKLTSIYFLSSYRNAMRLAEYEEIFAERIRNEVEKISPFATTSNVLLMNGYDQEMVPDNILPEIENTSFENIEVTQSTPLEYVKAIEGENPDLETLKGALYSGRYISVFPGILSARMYLKLKNDRCQRELENYTEPYSVFSWLNGDRYPHQDLVATWKKLLKNHPHDSICGVSIDEVHTDMEKRFKEVLEKVRHITEKKLNMMANNINTLTDEKGKPFVVFNSSLKRRNEVIKIEEIENPVTVVDKQGQKLLSQKGRENNLYVYLNDIPAAGYRTIYMKDNIDSESTNEKVIVDKEKNIMENEYLKVKINGNGGINVTDKTHNTKYENMGLFLDEADAGDEYNYSPPREDIKIDTEEDIADIEMVEDGPLRAIFKVSLTLDLPESLTEDRKTRITNRRKMPVVNWISLDIDSKTVEFRTEVKNTVKDHRLRVLFPTGIDTPYSQAGTQFDITEHEIEPEQFDNSEIPENVKRIIIGARESEPITDFPQRYFVDLNNGDHGVAVLNRGLPEYEILPENNTIALTLFRSVGWLARGDLLSRIGDAGPEIFTPDAQCLREMTFEYALYFHDGDCCQGGVYDRAKKYNNPVKIVETTQHEGILNEEKENLRLTSPGDVLEVTALKKAEREDAIVLRLFNPSDEEVEGKIETGFSINNAFLVNMAEEVRKGIEHRDESLSITLKPREIKTIMLDLETRSGLKRINERNIIYSGDRNFEKPDFDKFTIVAPVTRDDIKEEKQRWQELRRKIKETKDKAEEIREKLDNNQFEDKIEKAKLEARYHQLKGNITTYERAALEARLSLVLTGKKYYDIFKKEQDYYDRVMEAIDRTLREIGYDLNRARVNKRVYEYIVEYYNHRLKLISNK